MTCKLSAIVAVCDDWGIGCEGDMVVSNRADMRHFVACTCLLYTSDAADE